MRRSFIFIGRRLTPFFLGVIIWNPIWQVDTNSTWKLQVKVDTQLFRGVHYEIIAYDELGNEWMIHSTRKAIVGEEIGLDFEPEDIHIMRLNETEEEFDARIEEYVEIEEQEAGLINAIEEERDEENKL